jgi:hypothetical protein
MINFLEKDVTKKGAEAPFQISPKCGRPSVDE